MGTERRGMVKRTVRYIKIQLEREVLRTKTKERGCYANIFHIHSNVFLLFLSSLPNYQAEYLIFRKWPIKIIRKDYVFANVGRVALILEQT